MSNETDNIADYEVELLRDMYRQMKLIRHFENVVDELCRSGEIFTDAHLCQGQEAVPVGACMPLRGEDFITSTHRPHGHVLAKGIDPKKAMAEIGGKESGISGGRGGEMHMFDPSIGIIGSNGIVGASLPHAVGATLSARFDGDDRVAVGFFGDGASNQGVVHEAMNLAAVWELPVLFLLENNQYAVTAAARDTSAVEELSDRAAGYGMEGTTVDGQDVLAVYEAVSDAVESMRNGGGPVMIECLTYRYQHHTVAATKMLGDDYRSDEEVEKWQDLDPVVLFAQRLEDAGILDTDERKLIDNDVENTVAEAVEFMENGEFPEGANAAEHLYADADYPDIPQPRYK